MFHELQNIKILETWKKIVATPLWPNAGVKPNASKVGDLESSGTPECLEFDNKAKTPRIEVFLGSLERSWSVDIENGLALAIYTSTARVMGKRRVGSQTGSLCHNPTLAKCGGEAQHLQKMRIWSPPGLLNV